jgi:hypothetical protein
MVGKSFHVLVQPVRIEPLHRLESAGVDGATTVLEEAPP